MQIKLFSVFFFLRKESKIKYFKRILSKGLQIFNNIFNYVKYTKLLIFFIIIKILYKNFDFNYFKFYIIIIIYLNFYKMAEDQD